MQQPFWPSWNTLLLLEITWVIPLYILCLYLWDRFQIKDSRWWCIMSKSSLFILENTIPSKSVIQQVWKGQCGCFMTKLVAGEPSSLPLVGLNHILFTSLQECPVPSCPDPNHQGSCNQANFSNQLSLGCHKKGSQMCSRVNKVVTRGSEEGERRTSKIRSKIEKIGL